MLNKKLKLAALAVGLIGSIAATPSHAAVTQLGFILDRSGSIGSPNWTTIVNGLASAVNTLIPIDGTYEISVVSFSSGAFIDVNSVLVTSAATRSAVATSIANIVFTGGSTNFAAAFNSMQTALTDGVCSNYGTAPCTTPTTAAASYVNFSTDGVPDNNAAGEAARNALITAGIDNISIEGIGGGVNAANLQNNYCYPQVCDTTIPFSFPAQGFYIAVADAQAYANAIGTKIRVVTGQVPEPGSLALAGLGLLGLFGMRRRVNQA
jgi:hypothetical protein